MKLLTISCRSCGAPLEAPVHVAQITCEFCGTRLQVQRSGTAAFTETVGEAVPRINRIADDAQRIRLEQELARLDREWELQRQEFLVRGRDGVLSVPNKTAVSIGGVAVSAFGVLWTIMALGITTAGMGIAGPAGLVGLLLPCFGVVFVILAAGTAIHGFRKAVAFGQFQHEYRTRRQRLLAQLEASSPIASTQTS